MKLGLGPWIVTILLICGVQPAWAGDDQATTIRIVMLGDTSFGESYQDLRARHGRENLLETRGYDHMIGNFASLLDLADFTLANLETPITDAFPSPFAGEKSYIHYADVEKTPLYLSKYGIDLVSLANNHGMDFGPAGLRQTLDRLTARQIDSCGAGHDATAAARAHVRRFQLGDKPFHVAFLCLFEYREDYATRYGFYATSERGGVNQLSVEAVSKTIEALRARHPNLFVIAFPHWGPNYAWASEDQRAQARALVAAGVDLIVGHGAHMVQEIETVDGRWVVYGLGNFVFGSPGRYQSRKAPPYGAVAMLLLTATEAGIAKTLRLYPIFTDNRVTDYRSRFVAAAEFEALRHMLWARSRHRGEFDRLVRSGSDDLGRFLEVDLEP